MVLDDRENPQTSSNIEKKTVDNDQISIKLDQNEEIKKEISVDNFISTPEIANYNSVPVVGLDPDPSNQLHQMNHFGDCDAQTIDLPNSENQA